MSISKKLFSRNLISLALLLLILLRLVPFNLLHHHNGEFASFNVSVDISDTQTTNERFLDEASNSCTFHQFLDLINHGFFIDSNLRIFNADLFDEEHIQYTENRLDVISIYILNKGSPALA